MNTLYPLNNDQLAVYLDLLKNPDIRKYHLGFYIVFRAELDPEVFRKALVRLYDGEPALKVVLREENERYFQQVLESQSPPFEFQELPGASRSDIQELFRRKINAPYDLFKGPLTRNLLVRTAPDEYTSLFASHHLISDTTTAKNFFDKLSRVYQQLKDGAEPGAVDYSFFEYLEAYPTTVDLPETVDYWRRKCKTADPLSFRLGDQDQKNELSISHILDEKQSSQLRDYCAKNQSHPAALFLAVYAFLIRRYSSMETDFPILSYYHGRSKAQFESLGFFIKTLPVIAPSEEKGISVADWVSGFQRAFVEMKSHANISSFEIFKSLKNQETLFTFNYYPFRAMWVEFLGSKAEIQDDLLSHTALNRPALTVIEREKIFEIRLNYFDAPEGFVLESWSQRIELLAGQLLGGVTKVNELQVFDPDKKLVRKNAMQGRRKQITPSNSFDFFEKKEIEQSITERFEKQVKKHPKNLAVQTKNFSWNYEELSRRVKFIAHTLLDRLGPGEGRVALLFEHDAPMVSAILGVLKAGKTYVPIDPLYPKDRSDCILEDAAVEAILTNDKNSELASSFTSRQTVLINIDRLSDDLSVSPEPFLPSKDRLAYLLYTSGSTGRPKGVMQSHRNVLFHIRNYTNALHINPNDKVTLFSSYGHDASVMDIFGALLNGATLFPVNPKETDFVEMARFLEEKEITIFHSIPTLFRYLSDSLSGKENLSRIRLVVLGGEEVRRSDFDLYKKHFSSQCIFINGLGPTESTLALQNFLNKGTELQRSSVPAGYPVEGTEVMLFDIFGRETDFLGEIVIRSSNLALGYWKRPDLTERVFLPDPQGGEARLYKTGDMGRFLPDGSIEHAGRKDFQVKIHGFRIELGEIESIQRSHSEIRDAVVIAKDKDAGEKYLVAYLIAKDPGNPPSADILRNFLKTKLPEHMIPSFFVFLEEFPKLPNGKLNRNAFPALQTFDLAAATSNYVPPRTSEEKILCDIWKEVLKVDRVGIHDNFFELGGSSLSVIACLSRMRDALKINIGASVLFDAKNIADLIEKTHVFSQAVRPEEENLMKKKAIPQKVIVKKSSNLFHLLVGDVLRYFALKHGKFVWLYRKVCNPRTHEWTEFLKRRKFLYAIGENSGIAPDVIITDPKLVRIGNNVWLTGCTLLGHDGGANLINRIYSTTLDAVGKIDVKDNVLINYHAIITRGVTIGPNAIVAAGAVVTRDVPPNSVVAGNPAQVIGSFDDYMAFLKVQNETLPWKKIIEERKGAFDWRLEPELERLRTKYFFEGNDSSK